VSFCSIVDGKIANFVPKILFEKALGYVLEAFRDNKVVDK
jgi:hypothetical protein